MSLEQLTFCRPKHEWPYENGWGERHGLCLPVSAPLLLGTVCIFILIFPSLFKLGFGMQMFLPKFLPCALEVLKIRAGLWDGSYGYGIWLVFSSTMVPDSNPDLFGPHLSSSLGYISKGQTYHYIIFRSREFLWEVGNKNGMLILVGFSDKKGQFGSFISIFCK